MQALHLRLLVSRLDSRLHRHSFGDEVTQGGFDHSAAVILYAVYEAAQNEAFFHFFSSSS